MATVVGGAAQVFCAGPPKRARSLPHLDALPHPPSGKGAVTLAPRLTASPECEFTRNPEGPAPSRSTAVKKTVSVSKRAGGQSLRAA